MPGGIEMSVKAAMPLQDQKNHQSELDEVDESEIDSAAEEKAHDKVNMIPNSQVTRNQSNGIQLNNSFAHMNDPKHRSAAITANMMDHSPARNLNTSIQNSQIINFENAQ